MIFDFMIDIDYVLYQLFLKIKSYSVSKYFFYPEQIIYGFIQYTHVAVPAIKAYYHLGKYIESLLQNSST